MIEGICLVECDYCWKIEDLKSGETSDCILKSASEWSITEFESIVKAPLDIKIKPKYLEVSFSNTCQFKCSYCSSNFSSSWAEEIEKFGEYPNKIGSMTLKILKEEDSIYVKAFWDWWPALKTGLHTFRITGGEPLLSPSTFKVMEELLLHPEPNLSLAVNTNLGAPPVLIEKFIALVRRILSEKAVKKFEVFTSVDTYGPQAEYIRHGLKHEVFWNNIEKILQISDNSRINIMCTFNALSVDSFIPFLQKILDMNAKFRNSKRVLPIYVDISYLRDPDYQTVRILPQEYHKKMERIVQFIQDNQWDKKSENMLFLEDQYLKAKRILEWMRLPMGSEERRILQRRFHSFFSEHDRRRNTSFVAVFPELAGFWKECEMQC